MESSRPRQWASMQAVASVKPSKSGPLEAVAASASSGMDCRVPEAVSSVTPSSSAGCVPQVRLSIPHM